MKTHVVVESRHEGNGAMTLVQIGEAGDGLTPGRVRVGQLARKAYALVGRGGARKRRARCGGRAATSRETVPWSGRMAGVGGAAKVAAECCERNLNGWM